MYPLTLVMRSIHLERDNVSSAIDATDLHLEPIGYEFRTADDAASKDCSNLQPTAICRNR
jgi:hypothetical protein